MTAPSGVARRVVGSTACVAVVAGSGSSVRRAGAPLAVAAGAAPVATSSRVSTTEDRAVAIRLSGRTTSGTALRYALASKPSHGTVTGTAPALTYTPQKDWSGTDSLRYTVAADGAISAAATVTISVAGVNDAPVASDVSATTTEESPVEVALVGRDTETTSLTYQVLAGPSHGGLSGTGSALTYQPASEFVGTDTFTYTVSDGSLTSAPATATISVDEPTGFTPSGFVGAGFVNVVAVDPRGSGTVLAGGDVSGIHRSTDGGRSFVTSNTGLTNLNQLKVAALQFSPTVANKVYAAIGYRGNNGAGLFVSEDGGKSWVLRSPDVRFSGANNNAPGLPTTHPRSTGTLLAFDTTRGLIYAATFADGVMRSADDGRTWTPMGLAGVYLRGIAIDSTNPNIVYAASYGNGVYRTTSASGAGTFTRMSASPSRVEEIVTVGSKVYAVAGSAGVVASNDLGLSWTSLNGTGIRTDGPVWLSIDAYRNAATGKDVLIVGNDAPARTGRDIFDSVMRSDDSGATWRTLTGSTASINATMGGPTGKPWWLLADQPYFAIGKGAYTAAQIVVPAYDRSSIYVAGRSGMWSSADGGTTWYPMVKGLGVTINNAVVADPDVPGRVYVANTDWIVLVSDDSGRNVRQNRPPTGAMGTTLAVDGATSPAVLYAGVGDRDTNSSGEVYRNADPAGTGTWVSLGLGDVTGGLRPQAVTVRTVGGVTTVIVAVEQSGVWRKSGTGPWQRVASGPLASAGSDWATMTWVRGTSTVLLHDMLSGLWRSGDEGRTWTRIWAGTSQASITSSFAVSAAGEAYLAGADGVYRIAGAVSGTGVAATKLSGIFRPGPIVIDASGRLWVTEMASSRGAGSLWRSSDFGASWTGMDDLVYEGTAGFVRGMDVDSRGELYFALNGNGLLRGYFPVR